MKHPLLNEDSKHYDGDKPAIQELEENLTLSEAIGFAKGNAFKYDYRKDSKGSKDSDIKKQRTFINYLQFLFEIEANINSHKKNNELMHKKLSEVYKILNIEIDYKL
jgi:hypothetical protein